MIVPTVHLNGTSIESLRAANRAVADALRVLVEAMQEAAPHGRDYYPQGSDVINAAVREHCVRLDVVRQLRLEYEAIAEAIENQAARKRAP